MEKKKRGGGRVNHRGLAIQRDLQQTLSRVTLAHFDSSHKCTTRAWVQMSDNYLALRPMAEDEANKFAIPHLDGVAHEWWHRGLITLGHVDMRLVTTRNTK